MSSVALDPALASELVADESPLRVAIYLADQNPHRDRSLGITSMTRSLMAKMGDRSDLAITQVISRSSYAENRQRFETLQLPFRTDRTLGRLVADGFHSWLVRPNVDLWYYPKGYVARLRGKTPSIGTMHDTIVQHYADNYPQSRSRRAFRYWIAQTKRSLARHSCVLTVSQHAANQLTDFCERHRVKPPPIKVTYEGSSWESFRGQTHDKSESVVHLASSAPHKGTNRLLQLWSELSVRVDLPPLTLIGSVDAQGQELMNSLAGVELVPQLSQDELRDRVAHSRALLLPSEIEGFGLPALEAYYVDTPVVYVAGTSVCEVVQDPDQVGQYQLHDANSFRRALDNVLALPLSRVREIGNDMYNRFATDRICERVVRIMRECVTGY